MSDAPTGLEDFRILLKLQELDTEFDQLRHRREHLPAHESLAGVQVRAVALRPLLSKATAMRDEVASRLLIIESEVETIESRVAVINSRLYDGSANIASSDALAMSHEVSHLNERRSGLEDQELAAMEEMEPLDAEVAKLEAEAHHLGIEMQAAQRLIAEEQAAIDEQIASRASDHQALTSAVPASLLKTYENLRGKLGGIAVARLAGNVCGGCHLVLSATEVAQINKAPATDVIHCDECDRILVR